MFVFLPYEQVEFRRRTLKTVEGMLRAPVNNLLAFYNGVQTLLICDPGVTFSPTFYLSPTGVAGTPLLRAYGFTDAGVTKDLF